MGQIVLGIDPGTAVMGYGIVEHVQCRVRVVQHGIVRLHRQESHVLKLHRVFTSVCGLIDKFRPDRVALEAPFYGKNVQSMLKLGRVQGVVMAAALNSEIPVAEYAPRKVKQAITGYGNASKEQVAKMLGSLLHLSAAPDSLDASDALAVAVCYVYQSQQSLAKPASWEQFLRANPDRILRSV